MSPVAVFLADPGRAQALDEVLRPAVRAIVAGSEGELQRLVADEHVSAVVIDQELPGALRGLDVVRRLFTDLLRPKTILVGDLTPGEREAAARLGVEVARPQGADELAKRTLAVIAAERECRTIPFEARRLVSNVEFVGPSPQLLVKLVEYLDHEKASVKDLARDVSVDARSTAELLKLTNSAACGLRRKATTVLEAVNLLGIRRTVSMILSAGVVSSQRGMMNGVPEHVSQWFQRRTVQIASVASTFAGSLEGISGETAHVLGLLQDLGILVLCKTFREKYLPLLERTNTIGMLQLAGVERQQFGFTHAEVGAALLDRWKLPESFVELVLTHHGEGDGLSEIDLRFRRVMQIGEAVACCVASPTPQRQHALHRLLQHYGPENAARVKECLEKSTARARESSQLFSMPAPSPLEISLLLPEMQELVGNMEGAASEVVACA